jgi:hypothetical protein
MKRAAIAGLFALLVTSCVTTPHYTEVGRQRQTIGSAYSVDPQIVWSRIASEKFESWTVDGPALDEVSFANGIGDGEAVVLLSPQEQIAAKLGQRTPLPVFRKDMTPSEIMELITDSLTSIGFTNVAAHDLQPFDFGGRHGFRFSLTMATSASLEERGRSVGMVENGRLYLITFRAAADYYYPKYQAIVDRMLGSIVVS